MITDVAELFADARRLTRTMGTMRNNFVAAFLPLILMSSASQSFRVHGSGEDSLKRNNLPDALTGSHRPTQSTSTSNYECLFIDPKLPICDFSLMLNSEESMSETNSLKRDVNRNIDVSNVDVIVYTIEGCLPPRLSFRMPSCDGISLDRIVDVRRLRPFAVKRVTKPPFVFPKFNYSRWLHMVKQLQNRAPTKTRDATGSSDESSLRQSNQGLTEELMNAATTKETMPNAIAASMKTSNGSSPNKLIPGDTRSLDSTDQLTKSPKNATTDGDVTPESSSNAEVPPALQYHKALNSDSDNDRLKSSDGSEIIEPSLDADISGILAVEKSRFMNEQTVMKEDSNVPLDYANSQKSLQLPGSVQVDETDNGDVDDLLLTEIASAAFRRRREIRLHVPGQEIGDEPKVRTVTGEPISRRFQRSRETSRFNSNQFANSAKSRRQFKVRVDEEGMMNKNMPMVRVPLLKTKSNSNKKLKHNGWFGLKSTWQKSRKYHR